MSSDSPGNKIPKNKSDKVSPVSVHYQTEPGEYEPSGNKRSQVVPTKPSWVAYWCRPCERVNVVLVCLCGDRLFCPWCRKKRIQCLRKAYIEPLNTFKVPRFLTLTTKRRGGLDCLVADIHRLKQAFQKLQRRSIWCGSANGRKNVEDYFGSLEFVENNVHLHLLLKGNFIDQGKLQKVWSECLGELGVVDVRRAYYKNGEGMKMYDYFGNAEKLSRVVQEVFKYVTKDKDYSPSELSQLSELLKGERLIFASKKLSLKRVVASFNTVSYKSSRECSSCMVQMKRAGSFSSLDLLLFCWTTVDVYRNEKLYRKRLISMSG